MVEVYLYKVYLVINQVVHDVMNDLWKLPSDGV